MTKTDTDRITLGVALGGGGARGLAHIGILQALKAAGIEAQIVTGTSIGAYVGAAYACNKLDEMEKIFLNTGLADLPGLLGPTLSSQGLFSARNALAALSDLLSVQKIENMPRRFAAVSVDLLKAETVVHTTGDLQSAVRASLAVPGLFTPVVQGSQLLVDGGVLEPVPVQAARNLGADVVIAIDLFRNTPSERLGLPPLLTPQLPPKVDKVLEHLRNLPRKIPLLQTVKEGKDTEDLDANMFDLVHRTLQVIQYHMTSLRFALYPADLVLAPNVADFSFLDFHRASELTARGRDEVSLHLPAIKSMLADFLAPSKNLLEKNGRDG